ncbi:hypothetical protein JTB14_021839 [Gonioctena quinquepunctata]|nr:hypothetical protein JTB14_021839 [Gonioctena quinquepunctata]
MCLLECSRNVVKIILWVFNVVIFAGALLLISFAVNYQNKNEGSVHGSIGICAIVLASIVALVSFFGCYGACRGGGCALITYATICIVLCILLTALTAVVFVLADKVTSITDKIDIALAAFYLTDPKKVDSIQNEFECCGRMGYDDPLVLNRTISENEQDGYILIDSCCGNGAQPCTEDDAYGKECAPVMVKWVQTHMRRIGLVSAIFAIIELLAALFAIFVSVTGHIRPAGDGRA